ncbi:hypothetical protein MBLNU459_g5277t1 [Dothideomycetes sp. NU459]
MAYLFYTVSFLFLAFATLLYATRSTWLPHAPPIPYLTAPGPVPSTLLSYPPLSWFRSSSHRYIALPSGNSVGGGGGSGSFQSDLEAGFSSSTFDLHENLESGDSRQGLDERGKAEVQRIMREKKCGFDEARRAWMVERFGRENIGADGRPRDPKAVMFDR